MNYSMTRTPPELCWKVLGTSTGDLAIEFTATKKRSFGKAHKHIGMQRERAIKVLRNKVEL